MLEKPDRTAQPYHRVTTIVYHDVPQSGQYQSSHCLPPVVSAPGCSYSHLMPSHSEENLTEGPAILLYR